MKYLIAVCCSLLLCTQVFASQQAVLLGPDLEPVSVRLQAISSDVIKVVDGRGDTQTLKPEDVLRLTFSRRALETPDPSRAIVTLRDGQVLVGKLVPSNDEEAIRLTLDNDRAVQVPLDEMLSLVIEAGATAPAVEEDDALLLATGEVLLGFVETFSKDAIGFVIGDSDDAIEIPLDRIKAVAIANKPRQAQVNPGTARVTTIDGSVLLIENATLNAEQSGDRLMGVSTLPIVSSNASDDGVSTASSSRLSFSMDRILTIEPVSSRYQLSSLSEHDWQVVSGAEVFGVAMLPSKTAAGDLRLHAPVEVRFDLPKGARRLAFTVAMDLDDTIPDSRRAMAGCELLIYVGDEVIA
ncbi:MAG: hypothetical protein AB8C95_03005, partial [Phycisphaeraceae bacterium]